MADSSSGYARPEMLVDTAWLAEHINDANIRLVDTDNRDAYRRAHITSAVSIRDSYLKDPENRHHILAPAKFAEHMSRLGIGDDTLVIAYDGFGTLYSSRLWWALNYYGHDKVKVLNGGWNLWLKEGRAITQVEPRYPRTTFTPQIDESLMATAEYVLEAMKRPDVALLDTRSDEEFSGENPRGTKYGGYIPGAVHIEWLNHVTKDDLQMLKPASELREMFQAAGITPEKEIITY